MAVPAAGTFTASQLLKVQAMADDLWMDNQTQSDYVARCEVVKALMAEQTAQLAPLQDPEKTRTVKLIWLNACGVTTAAVDDDCSITGTELSSDSKEYAIDLFRTSSFSIKEIKSRTDEFSMGQQAAKGLLAADKALCEWLAGQAVAKLETFRGTNVYTAPVGATAWTFASSDTTIPADQWDTTLMPRLSLAAEKNYMTNPYLLTGEAMWYINEEAVNNQGNLDGKGDNVRNQKYFRAKYFDPFAIDSNNSPDYKAYMIDRGAVAVVSKSHYPDVPVTYHNPYQTRYRMESRNLPGIVFEVTYSQSCISSETTHVWQLKLNAGIYLNPTGCTETRTGVLSFVREIGL